jgi:hypothetical protein
MVGSRQPPSGLRVHFQGRQVAVLRPGHPPFTFGRGQDRTLRFGHDVHGKSDRYISRNVGSILYDDGLWVVCNDSTSRPFDVIVRGCPTHYRRTPHQTRTLGGLSARPDWRSGSARRPGGTCSRSSSTPPLLGPRWRLQSTGNPPPSRCVDQPPTNGCCSRPSSSPCPIPETRSAIGRPPGTRPPHSPTASRSPKEPSKTA